MPVLLHCLFPAPALALLRVRCGGRRTLAGAMGGDAACVEGSHHGSSLRVENQDPVAAQKMRVLV